MNRQTWLLAGSALGLLMAAAPAASAAQPANQPSLHATEGASFVLLAQAETEEEKLLRLQKEADEKLKPAPAEEPAPAA